MTGRNHLTSWLFSLLTLLIVFGFGLTLSCSPGSVEKLYIQPGLTEADFRQASPELAEYCANALESQASRTAAGFYASGESRLVETLYFRPNRTAEPSFEVGPVDFRADVAVDGTVIKVHARTPDSKSLTLTGALSVLEMTVSSVRKLGWKCLTGPCSGAREALLANVARDPDCRRKFCRRWVGVKFETDGRGWLQLSAYESAVDKFGFALSYISADNVEKSRIVRGVEKHE